MTIEIAKDYNHKPAIVKCTNNYSFLCRVAICDPSLYCQVLLDYSHNLDRLRSPYHHQGRLQTTQEEEEEAEGEGEEKEYESGIRSGDSQTALT